MKNLKVKLKMSIIIIMSMAMVIVGGFVAVGYGVSGADVVAAQAQGAGVAPVWPAISGDGDVSKRT